MPLRSFTAQQYVAGSVQLEKTLGVVAQEDFVTSLMGRSPFFASFV
jgi:hypothetical protein